MFKNFEYPIILSLSSSWSLIKILLSFFPKADIKIVQLDLLGVAIVFFSFISYLQICFTLSLHFRRPIIGHPPYIEIFLPSLSILFEYGPIRTQVCLRTERLVKQTNKQTNNKWCSLIQSKNGASIFALPIMCRYTRCSNATDTINELIYCRFSSKMMFVYGTTEKRNVFQLQKVWATKAK